MTERLNDAEAFAVADAVLSRHGYDANCPSMGGVADGLGIASDEVDIWTDTAIDQKKSHELRASKIEHLQCLLRLYESDVDQQDLDYVLRQRGVSGLTDQVSVIEELLAAECNIHSVKPAGGLRNARPPKPKNVGAECIYKVLRENGIKPWTACSIIAEMLIEAGVDDREHRKVLRSLFDKLNRKEVR